MGTSIIISIFWGIVGIAYFSYGRKQQNNVALISGIALMAFPYLISNLFAVVFIGVVLVVLPFFIRY